MTNYSIIYNIINPVEFILKANAKKVSLKRGYYKFNFELNLIQYSSDRNDWVEDEQFKTFVEFNEIEPYSQMKIEQMEYVETIKYKNQLVPVFIDDSGQCFYAIYKNMEIVFGAYQDNYEDEIKYLIDQD